MENTLSKCVGAAFAVSIVIGLMPQPADASITSVKVQTKKSFPGANDYTYAEIRITGRVARADGTTGTYRVPAVLIYPNRSGSGDDDELGGGNKVGIVDWVNTVFYHLNPPTTEFKTFQFTRFSTDEYLFEEGYTYLSIQWDKAVTEIFGAAAPNDGQPHNHMVYGTIERSADAWEILRDAARFLKQPSAFPGQDGPRAVDTVLSSGYSQSASLQLEFLVLGSDPSQLYDGHLISMTGFECWKREEVPPFFGTSVPCSGLPGGNHAKVIVLASESDMNAPQIFGSGRSAFLVRNAGDPRWRQYEMAGIAHLPRTILNVNVPEQNPADAKPVFRAAINNLMKWADGLTPPPPSLFFQGQLNSADEFVPVADADGNWLGGLRLTHMPSTVGNQAAGAPLGTYAGLNFAGLDPFDAFVFLGGTFSRFSDASLESRYQSRSKYVDRVRRAADRLVQQRYILDDDRNALIDRAEEEPLPF